MANEEAKVTQYPNADFQKIYEGIINSMGTDDQLRANLEAALRPMYEQSKAELEQQRRANNAAIDVDAFSRGMGNSTWTTDAKLQNLRNAESNLAALGANYNNTLFTNLMNAIADRDKNAFNQAMTFWQYDQSKKGGGGGPKKKDDSFEDEFEKWKADFTKESFKAPQLPNMQPTINFSNFTNFRGAK